MKNYKVTIRTKKGSHFYFQGDIYVNGFDEDDAKTNAFNKLSNITFQKDNSFWNVEKIEHLK